MNWARPTLLLLRAGTGDETHQVQDFSDWNGSPHGLEVDSRHERSPAGPEKRNPYLPGIGNHSLPVWENPRRSPASARLQNAGPCLANCFLKLAHHLLELGAQGLLARR